MYPPPSTPVNLMMLPIFPLSFKPNRLLNILPHKPQLKLNIIKINKKKRKEKHKEKHKVKAFVSIIMIFLAC